MNITMTIEVTPEQAVHIAEILRESAPEPIKQPSLPQKPIAPPVQQTATSSAPAVPVTPAPIPAAMPQTVPVQPAVPTAAPVQSALPVSAPPTAVRKYTADEISLASRPIVEAGRQQELLALLHSFTFTDQNGVTRNVQNIREMPEELYPAFANGIRQLGGRI